MLTRSVNALPKGSWALLINTARTPQCKHCLGKFVDMGYPLPSPPKFKGVPLAEASGRLEPEKVEHLSAKMQHFH